VVGMIVVFTDRIVKTNETVQSPRHVRRPSLDTHQPSPTSRGAGIAALPASTKNADVLNAITVHHTRLVNEMRSLTAAVVDGARSGSYDQALSALMSWFTLEFIPHAHAKEVTLYSAGSRLAITRLLVDGLLAEHRAIEALMTDLTYARDPFTVIASTAAAQAVFAVHLSKDNEPLSVRLPEGVCARHRRPW